MLTFPQIDPIALRLGPLQIHWYAITYLVGFGFAWWLGNRRADRPGSGWTRQQVADLITNGMLGVILGGRIGHILFYEFGDFLDDPLMIFRVWNGGMSFHGGFLGVIAAVTLFARFNRKSAIEVLDFVAPLAPLGLGAGRIGNFINGELWGRATDVPWAMVFPKDLERLPRHPSCTSLHSKVSSCSHCCGGIRPSRGRPLPRERCSASATAASASSWNFSASPIWISASLPSAGLPRASCCLRP
jgi:phosphatidylglycerol---prolipoprotein diacylglyceryl transferase